MNKNSQKHEFAFYVPELKKGQKTITVNDPELLKRIESVLRLQVGEEIVFFSREIHVFARLDILTKKQIQAIVLKEEKNKEYAPFLTVLLPILKREALEAALYACTELGVNEVYLVSTQKSLQKQKDEKRYERIVIAAAEQSKNFSFPFVHSVQSLEEVLLMVEKEGRVFADPSGKSLSTIIEKPKTSYVLMVGPEGDLTDDEKKLLQKEGFYFCHLTPTVLRSQQALSVLIGSFRTFL